MTAERFYGALLALYPKAFRREYGDAMATSGLVVGALTARPVSTMLSRPR
jgi:hypothetical protein